MDKQKLHYCFTMSDAQLEFLRTKKYNIDRMECFMSLVTMAVRETKQIPVSKTQQVEILRGQLMIDNTKLAQLWNKDRKTVPKILEAMERMGISSSQKVGENRIHTLHCLSGWYINGKFQANEFSLRRQGETSEVFHREVPPSKLITIEAPDAQNTDGDSKPNAADNSNGTTEGKLSATSGNANPQSSPTTINGSMGNTSPQG